LRAVCLPRCLPRRRLFSIIARAVCVGSMSDTPKACAIIRSSNDRPARAFCCGGALVPAVPRYAPGGRSERRLWSSCWPSPHRGSDRRPRSDCTWRSWPTIAAAASPPASPVIGAKLGAVCRRPYTVFRYSRQRKTFSESGRSGQSSIPCRPRHRKHPWWPATADQRLAFVVSDISNHQVGGAPNSIGSPWCPDPFVSGGAPASH
jgi:hypothetical protein